MSNLELAEYVETELERNPLLERDEGAPEADAAAQEPSGVDDVIDNAPLDKALAREDFDSQVAKGAAWIGTPARILEAVRAYNEQVGGFEIASLQVNFNDVALADAEASMRLFGEEVLPRLPRL